VVVVVVAEEVAVVAVVEVVAETISGLLLGLGLV
jgi:hypothetical protein